MKCYVPDTVNTVNGKTMHDLHQATVQKTMYLKDHGCQVVEVWECDIQRELEQNEDMKRYFDTYDLVDLWNLRMHFLAVEPTQPNFTTNGRKMKK